MNNIYLMAWNAAPIKLWILNLAVTNTEIKNQAPVIMIVYVNSYECVSHTVLSWRHETEA